MTGGVQYAKSGDLYIAYRVLGEGPIDLVFVSGLISHVDMWSEWPASRQAIERLASFSRLILFDKRGTGLSDRVGPEVTFEDVMDDVRAVMDAVGSERAALFGTADGAVACCLFAASYPHRTHSLSIYGSYARRSADPDYPWGIADDVHEKAIEVYESKWGREPVGIRTLAPSLADDRRFRDFYVRIQRYAASPGAAIAWYRMQSQIDIRNVLQLIRVPTLVLHRSGDMTSTVENGRFLAENISGAKYVELGGDDHFFSAGDSDALIDEIEIFLTGTRRVTDPDRILATVLFTDIVGSTDMANRLGDRRWRELLDAHDAEVRGQIQEFRGRVVKSTGDGFLAIFDGPGRAIRCAHGVIERLRPLGVEVRTGVHSGECEVRGDDVGGIAVAIAARIVSLADPGEVLVSSTVKDLVIGAGFAFEERGTEVLKGVPGEWGIFRAGGRAEPV